MNTRQLQYAVLLSQVRSFSQAAESLHISQPALSKQIISLEEELGVKLFERTSPLTLTPAGEYFVTKAERLLAEEDQLLKTLDKYKSGENGKLIIGISPFRSLYLMPPFIREMRSLFPGLQIVLKEANSTQLHKGITEGAYDFAIMNLPVDESLLEVIPLEQDTLVLALPKDMAPLIAASSGSLPDEVDLADCAALPFIVLSPGQELRTQFDKLCHLAQLEPHIPLEVVGITTAWTMVQAGIGATILPRQFAQAYALQDVLLLPIRQKAVTRQPAVILRRGQYVSPYAQQAITLLRHM